MKLKFVIISLLLVFAYLQLASAAVVLNATDYIGFNISQNEIGRITSAQATLYTPLDLSYNEIKNVNEINKISSYAISHSYATNDALSPKVWLSDQGNVIIMSYEDNTSIFVNGKYKTTLNAGQSTSLALSAGSVITANKPFSTASTGSIVAVAVPISWAGYKFAYYVDRSDPQYIWIYSPFSTANVKIYNTTSLVTTLTISKGSYAYYSNSFVGNTLLIESDSPVIIWKRANGGDGIPLYPCSKELYGVASGGGSVCAVEDGTSVTMYTSSGSVSTASLNRGQCAGLPGGGSQYNGPATRIVANKPVCARAEADGDGYEQTPFTSTRQHATNFVLPNNAEFVALVSYKPTIVRVYNSTDVVCESTLSGTNGVYFVKLTSASCGLKAGYRIITDNPVWAIYEHLTQQDETILQGYNPASQAGLDSIKGTWASTGDFYVAGDVYAVNAHFNTINGGSPITGSGTANYVAKFTGSNTIGNSAIYESGGNVGIGTTSPTSKLFVNGGKTRVYSTDYSGGQLQIGNSADDEASIGFFTGASSDFSSYSQRWVIGPDVWNIGTDKFGIGNSGQSPTVKVTIANNGNVGIGTTSPADKLHVENGYITIRGTSPTIRFRDTDNYAGFIHMNSNWMYFLSSAGADATTWTKHGSYWPLRINMANDNIEIGGPTEFLEGNVYRYARTNEHGFLTYRDTPRTDQGYYSNYWTGSQRNIFKGYGLYMDMNRWSLNKVWYFDGANYYDRTYHAIWWGGAQLELPRDTNDIVYFGDSYMFWELYFDIVSPGAGYSLVWEYANGEDANGVCNSWASLPSLTDGTSGFTQDGWVYWGNPPDEVKCKVNGVDAYWVRVRTTTTPSTAANAYGVNIGFFIGYFLRFYNNNYERFRVDWWGNAYAWGSMRAPIFYDLNNGNYYVDPSGTSKFAGSVGIGTTSPSYKLHVKGDIYADGGWVRVSGARGIYFQSYGGGWYMTDSTWIRAYNNKPVYSGGEIRSGSNMKAPIFYDLDNTAYYLDPASPGNSLLVAGKVGIGTTSPTQKLDVAGNINASVYYDRDNSARYLDPSGTSYIGAVNMYGNLNIHNYNIVNANSISISDPGPGEGLVFGGTAAGWRIDVSPLDRSNADGNLNLYGTANNIVMWRPVLIAYNGTVYNTIQTTSAGDLGITGGKVGIGTTTPVEKLDVAGAIKIGNTASACDASHRGVLKLVPGASGVDDKLYMCMKNATDSYVWVLVARGS